ncbi:MAG: hypothetical protein C3F02_03965 [Parcubacteria group bacterium]|nr:MAG: hypothetical protein C3F02_03965 [Parcubacteria group bacterium]
MNKIVPNDNLSKHDCPLAVIKCVDFRFREADQEFIASGLGFKDFDLYAWPGAGKEILNGNGFKKTFVEKIVNVSINLHHIKKLLLLWHHDCGAYGGSKNFASAVAEEETYQKDLRAAKDMLAAELPAELEIIMAYSKTAPQGLEYVVIE